MQAKARAYISRTWKIKTPRQIVTLFWQITHKYKNVFDSVLDMGAGDGCFSLGGNYKKYVGVEIDHKRILSFHSTKTSFLLGCVFEHKEDNYSACIGNPPYLRHNEISNTWRKKIISRFNDRFGFKIDQRSNLYTYFLLLGLQKTKDDGLVSLLIPYEWIHIPSSKPIREFIKQNDWSVYVYRFKYPIFDTVLTTASICIIDKSNTQSEWKYFDLDINGTIKEVTFFTDSGYPALEHENRGRVWAMRGLSPGSKRIFTLSESERLASKLTRKDVRPCVTSFKEIPSSLKVLDKENFEKYFITKNKKCWLIKTDKKLTKSLKKYVQKIPIESRSSWTCQNQKPWYRYKMHPIPQLLISSAFKESGPRILSNEIKATAVGSVIGIHTDSAINIEFVHKKLLRFDFNSRVVPREGGLKKIAIKQVNAALNHLLNNNGRQKQ